MRNMAYTGDCEVMFVRIGYNRNGTCKPYQFSVQRKVTIRCERRRRYCVISVFKQNIGRCLISGLLGTCHWMSANKTFFHTQIVNHPVDISLDASNVCYYASGLNYILKK